MKKLLTKKYLLRGGVCFILIVLSFVLYLLSTDDYTDSKFRTMQDEISSVEKVDLTGLRDLQASGGPTIDFPHLKKQLSHIKKPIIIIDGMRENHGYINHRSTTFFGYHRRRLQARYLIRRLVFTGSPQILHEKIVPESVVARQHGFGYKNIEIDSRICTPVRYVDAFVNYFDSLPKDAWFHFHCRHGKGRTSMALVMYDIMKNAPTVSLEDIIKRQHLLGSVDLLDTTVWKGGTYSSETLEKRKKFIQGFYAFICQRKAGGLQTWSAWYHQYHNDKTAHRGAVK